MILFDESRFALGFLQNNSIDQSITFSLKQLSISRGRFELFLLYNEIFLAGTQPSMRLSSMKISRMNK